MKISTGASESHETPLPYDPGESPAVAPVTLVAGQLSGPTYDARDTVGEFQAQMHAGAADVSAAMSLGMAAEHGRRDHYAADILPTGSAYGDAMALSSSPLDPGAAPGEAEPTASYYDPPRGY
jgi:hypothetical protein